jgi:hypothetical protein
VSVVYIFRSFAQWEFHYIGLYGNLYEIPIFHVESEV